MGTFVSRPMKMHLKLKKNNKIDTKLFQSGRIHLLEDYAKSLKFDFFFPCLFFSLVFANIVHVEKHIVLLFRIITHFLFVILNLDVIVVVVVGTLIKFLSQFLKKTLHFLLEKIIHNIRRKTLKNLIIFIIVVFISQFNFK